MVRWAGVVARGLLAERTMPKTSPPRSSSWANARPPSLEDFEAIAHTAWLGLPAPFREMCGNVVIQVTDFAPQDVLAHFEMDSPYELTGLYHGVDLTQKSISDSGDGPDHVFLYRLPILLEWCERSNVSLGELISHVLVHEIGHHFGLSDEDMHAIEDAAD